MPTVKKSDKRAGKEAQWRRIQQVVFKYKNVLFIDADNVSSKQICQLRAKLRAINAEMVMGKNVSVIISTSEPLSDSRWVRRVARNLGIATRHLSLSKRFAPEASLPACLPFNLGVSFDCLRAARVPSYEESL